jgi:hypothetical protein
VEVCSIEAPVEGVGGGVVTLLECCDLLGEVLEVGEVIRREQLALNDGEVDLDLVQP